MVITGGAEIFVSLLAAGPLAEGHTVTKHSCTRAAPHPLSEAQ
jgi:hypothetical protein